MNKNKIFGIVILILLIVPQAFAFDLGGTLSESLGNVGREISRLIDNLYFRFGLTFILVFMIMYAIYAAGLNRVTVFKGSNGQPSRQGKVIAASLGLITAMGFAYWANFSASEFTGRILSVAGWFGGVAFALLIFALAYFNMRDEAGDPKWPMVLFTTGLGMVTYSVLLGEDGPLSGTMGGLGLLFIIIGFLFMIINAWGSSGDDGNGGGDGRPRAPSRVSNFNATPQADGTVLLSWDANPSDENITAYEVERQVPGGMFGWRRERRVGSSNSDSIVDNAAFVPNAQYRYMVRARNSTGVGPATYTSLEQHHDSVEGDIIYRDHQGVEWPINDMVVTLSGPSNHVSNPTGSDGHFSIPNVRRGVGNYNLAIKDNQGVYRDYTFNDLVSDDRFNVGKILVSPRDGVHAAIQGKVVDHSGADYVSQRLDVFAVGGFGRVDNIGNRTDAHGNIGVNNVPAGHVVNMYCVDPTGRYSLATSETVLLRRKISYSLPNIQLQVAGIYSIRGQFFEIDPTGTNRGVPNCTCTCKRISNNQEVNSEFDGNTGYKVDRLHPDNYKVYAEDETGRFRALRIPYRDNYLVYRQDQPLDIRMIPNSPVPGNVRIDRDGSGRVIARVEFV